ncbi:MAG: DUF932 domain-containing protein [Bryobacteraceae bacterium]|nr:DUF932 domain-containing protein [Bryobacteraceae bacterium]
MPRLTKLDDVLFPVGEHPVFVSLAENGSERRLSVPEKKAIVNRTTRRVLGIVSRGYRLVSNREALDMAQQCCRTVFPETKPGEWEARAADAPSTAGYCHIDLVHNTTALDFSVVPAAERPDVFGPFIRVTNSYNGLRALSFDIGFYRKICKNGMIIPDTIIRFKFTHLRRDIGETIQFEIAKDKLAKFKAAFADSLAGLRACAVSRPQSDSLIRGVLSLRPPQRLKPDIRELDDWKTLGGDLDEMTARYAGELGENAYAAFNAITEFASHPPENRCVHRDRHSLQRLAGSWLTSFSTECRKPGFRLDGYLTELAKPKAAPAEAP